MRESNYIQHLDRRWELEKDRQRGYRLGKKGEKNQWQSSWGGTKLDNASPFSSLHSFGDKSECLLGVYFTRIYCINLLKTLKDLFLYSYFFPLYFMFSSFSLPLFSSQSLPLYMSFHCFHLFPAFEFVEASVLYITNKMDIFHIPYGCSLGSVH